MFSDCCILELASVLHWLQCYLKKKIPVQALRVPGGLGSQISWQLADKGGKVVKPRHRPPLPHKELFLVLLSVSDWVDRRVKGLCQWKMSMATSRIEPATFRLVAQCLNQLRHRVLPYNFISGTKARRRKRIVFEEYGKRRTYIKFYPENLKRIWRYKELGIMV